MPASRLRAALLACCLLGAGGRPSPAQLPAGGIAGEIRDPSGAVVSGARVLARNTATGLERSATGDEQGTFALPLLPPGVYELSVEAQGFQDPRKRVVVQTGATTFVDVDLSVDVLEQVVEALDSMPELRYDWHGVDGVVSRFEIENLPLNGREFFQLAILEPGVTAAPRAGFFTRQFDVSVLGASANATRYTMDGSPVFNPLTGGTPQNSSQEVVQEFQIQTVNFDLATGLTGAGAVNVVTRSGGVSFRRSGRGAPDGSSSTAQSSPIRFPASPAFRCLRHSTSQPVRRTSGARKWFRSCRT